MHTQSNSTSDCSVFGHFTHLCKLFCILYMASFCTHALASENSAIERLSRYSAKDFDRTGQITETQIGHNVLKMIETLSDASKVAMNAKKAPSEEFIGQMIRVTLLTFKEDPGLQATDVIIPVYKKYKSAFDKRIHKLPDTEKKILQEAIKNSLREIQSGNG